MRCGHAVRWRGDLAVTLLILAVGCGAPDPGRRQYIEIPAPSLAGSIIQNSPAQPALVLLPPSYAESNQTFPVIYYLPGFTTDVTEYVDGTFYGFHFDEALDAAIENGRAQELVVVILNGRNALGGSFYVDSPVTGRWETHIVRDAIPFIESRYRIRRESACRAIAGESMGGFGALHLAMRHPDLFGAVFAISPTLFAEGGLEDQGMLSPPYVAAWRLESERMRSWPTDVAPARMAEFVASLYTADGGFAYRRGFAFAYGAAFAPAPAATPPWVAFPFGVDGDWLVADPEHKARLEAGCGDLSAKVARHGADLGRLRAIGLDIGRNDRLAWVPRGTRRFSELLAEAGIRHRLTEHDGGHIDRFGERVETEMLPFLSRILCNGAGVEGR